MAITSLAILKNDLRCCIEANINDRPCEVCSRRGESDCTGTLMRDCLKALQEKDIGICCANCRWSERVDEGMHCKLLKIEVYDKFYCAEGERR